MTDEQQAHPQFSEIKRWPFADLGKLYICLGRGRARAKMQIPGAPLAADVSM